MKTVLLFLMGISLSIPVLSQNKSLEEEMKKGFDTYTDGKTFNDWFRGAKIMEETGSKYPKEWLPDYWAGFFYTQLSFSIPKENVSERITKHVMLDASQKNFDNAFNKVDHMTPSIRSDFHVLQAMIYSFRGWYSEDDAAKNMFQNKAESEVKSAFRLNESNPLIMVNRAINLIKRKDYASVYAGRVLLLTAKNKYESRLRPRYMSTHWNEQFIGYWLGQANKGLKILTAQKTE